MGNGQFASKEDLDNHLTSKLADLERTIDQLSQEAPDSSSRSDLLRQCDHALSQITGEVHGLPTTISARERANYVNAVKKLSQRLQTIRKSRSSQRSFVFKSRSQQQGLNPKDNLQPAPGSSKAELEIHSVDSVESNVPTTEADRPNSEAPGPNTSTSPRLADQTANERTDNQSRIEALSDSWKVLQLGAGPNHSVSIHDIKRSVIDCTRHTSASSSLAGIQAKDVDQSLLLCGTVSGAAHLTNVTGSTITLSCQQLRVHSSHACLIYLYCSNQPVIEDCSDLRFAPLPSVLQGNGGSQAPNLWNQVQDFNWLKAQPSPNWRTLTEDDPRAVPEDIWDKMLGQDEGGRKAGQALALARVRMTQTGD